MIAKFKLRSRLTSIYIHYTVRACINLLWV